MEVGNELRAQQHRLDVERQQAAHLSNTVSPWMLPGHVPEAAVRHWQQHMAQHAQARLQHPPPVHAASARATESYAAASPAANAASPRKRLQPFHPDYVVHNKSPASAPKGTDSLHVFSTQHANSNVQKAQTRDASNGPVTASGQEGSDLHRTTQPGDHAAEDNDEVAERLRRIEALTERIARSQMEASSNSRPNVRIPSQTQVSRSQQRSGITPVNVSLPINTAGASMVYAAAEHATVPKVPAIASARSTPSQKAKLQALQRQQTSKSKPRNWNHSDP